MPQSTGDIVLYDASGNILVGQKASAASIPVTIASDQTSVATTVADVTSTGALAALNNNVQVVTAGLATVGFQLAAGTLIGTIVPECSFDSGTTWQATYFDTPSSGKVVSIVFASSNTATAATIVGIGGSGLSRVRVSAYSSGTANITVRATTRMDPSVIFAGPSGVAVPPSVAQVGGTDGTLLVPLRIKAASTAAAATDPSAVVALSPNSPIPTGANVIGAVTQSGTFTTAQGAPNTIANSWPVKVTDGTNTMPTADAAARAQFHKVTDGTNTAAVKAASTAAVATDPALVVAISPNNPISVSGTADVTSTGALGALNASVQVITAGLSTAGFQLIAGTLIGTIVPEVSLDNGTTWNATYFDTTSSGKVSSIVFASANTAMAATIVGVGGSGISRVRVSAYTSGTASATVRATTRMDPSVLFAGPSGIVVPPSIAQIGGSDGVNLQVVRIKNASTAAIATDPSLVVAFSPNSALPTGANVIGAVTQSGTFTTAQGAPNTVANSWPVKVTDGTNTMPTMDTVARAGFHKITDGTNTAAVKAASTAAVATDPALVVAISPNNPISVSGTADVTATGALGSLNANVQVITAGLGTVGFQLAAGTLIGTIVPEVSFDGGTTWNATYFDTPSSGKVSTIVFGSANTATAATIVGVGGSGISRVRVSAYTSGTASITLRATTRTDPSVLFAGPSGIVAPPSIAQVGGTDGTLLVPIRMKAASTAAVATDPALVVAISPNNPLTTTPSDFNGSGTLSSASSITATTTGTSTVVFTVTGGGLVGTYVFEGQSGGGNWTAIKAWIPTFGSYVASTTSPTFTAVVQSGGFSQVRIRVSSYTSGTSTINWNAGAGANTQSNALVNHAGLPISIVDRSAMVTGTQPGIPIIGQSSGVGRTVRLNRLGHSTPGHQTLMAVDSVEGSVINTWLWTSTVSGMATSQTSGLLTLNSGSSLTSGQYAILSSSKQFSVINQSPISCTFRASGSVQSNSIAEMGFGTPSGATATISDGAFFRITPFGTVISVTSFNGTETSNARASINASNYYLFIVTIEDDGARFVIEDASGIPIVDVFQTIPLTQPGVISPSHIPAFARVYNSGTATSAPQIKINSFQAWQYDIDSSKEWSDQQAGIGRSANIVPTTFAQAAQESQTTIPGGTAATNTTCKYPTLGGEFVIFSSGGSENLLGVFGYQVPSPYSFYLTDISLPQPMVWNSATPAFIEMYQWHLMVASSNNPSAATGQVYTIGQFSVPASSPIGTVHNGSAVALSLKTPIVVLAGQYLLVLIKQISGTFGTSGQRGVIMLNGYYE